MTFQDLASMEAWFYEYEEVLIIPYIEKNFEEASYEYQYNFMFKHLIFAKAIIEDDMLNNEQKIDELIDKIRFGKSKIICVVGSRGSGKTATALFLGEKAEEEGGHKRIYYVGEPEAKDIYPKYFVFLKSLDDIPNGAFALIDEAGIKYNARMFRTKDNMELTEKMVILRHKDITLVLLTQNLKLLDINIRRLADIIIYKMGSDYGMEKKGYGTSTTADNEKALIISRLKPRTKDESLVEYLSGAYSVYRKFNHPLPSFWNDELISKSFANYVKEKSPQQKKRENAEDLLNG